MTFTQRMKRFGFWIVAIPTLFVAAIFYLMAALFATLLGISPQDADR